MSGALRHKDHNSLSGKRGICNEIWRRTGYQQEGRIAKRFSYVEFSGKFHAVANAEPQGSREGDQEYGDPLPGKADETDFGIEQEA